MKQSAGILLYRRQGTQLQLFLVHPGGPFWKAKDLGAWSIPKGEYAKEEDALAAARREFAEETGQPIDGDFLELTPVRQKAGKTVRAWAVQGDIDAAHIVSNTFEMEWPYRSGKRQAFPEVDRAAWFDIDEARKKINPAQACLITELAERLSG